MEELKSESLNKREKRFKKINENNKINDEKNKEIKKEDSDPNKIDPKKELEKIKQSHIQQYSFLELFRQSFILSFVSIKLPLFNLFLKFLMQYIDIKIPVIYGKLLNTIIKDKNYNKLCSQFAWHIFFLSLRVIMREIGEVFGFYFVGDSIFENKKMVLENIAKKDVEFFDLYRTGEIVDGIKKNEKMLEKNFLIQTMDFALDIWKFFYLLSFLKNTSFRLMIYFFIVQLLKFISDFLLATYTDFRNRKKKYESTNKYQSSLNEFISNIRLIKSLGIDDLYLDKLMHLKLKFFKAYCNIDNTVGPILEFFNKVLDTSITFLAGKYAINGIIDYSDLTIFQNYTNQLKKKFYKIKQFYKQYIELYHGWKRFFEYYYFQPKVISTKNYIPQDEKKSTLVTLLQRLYDPIEGEILLNNINLKEYNLKWLRQNIGCVFQEPMLLSGSIQENITYGLDDYDMEYFNEICRITNLDFVNDKTLFPHGFQTYVGERGGKLSGGQKQRIAIARALMRNIKVLILDEATSALDSKNEKDLQNEIEKITKTKNITTIIIAHRLSTVKNADEILFLDKGEIIEKGTHKELIEKKGEYYKLVQNQLINKEID